MKKAIFILFLGVLSIPAFSQSGSFSIGAKGGCIYSSSDRKFTNILYGIDVAYHLSSPLEVAFTGLMNPNIPYKEQTKKQTLAVYSANLDLRFYLINMRDWATGPALGGQYYIVNNKTDNLGADKALGFNIGWHIRFNLTDNLKLNGGWRYTNAKAKDKTHYWDSSASFDMSHNLFYVGLAYTFELGRH